MNYEEENAKLRAENEELRRELDAAWRDELFLTTTQYKRTSRYKNLNIPTDLERSFAILVGFVSKFKCLPEKRISGASQTLYSSEAFKITEEIILLLEKTEGGAIF